MRHGLRTTGAFRIVLAAAAAVGSLSVLTGSSWLVLLSGAFAGLVLQALFRRPALSGLTFCLSGPRRLAVGTSATYELHVHNHGPRSTPPVLVTHSVRGLADVTVHVEALDPGGKAVIELPRAALVRGVAEECEVSVLAHDPLHLLARTMTVAYRQELTVHPAPAWPSPSALSAARLDGAHAAGAVRGADLTGVREWRRGDDPGRVHWRATARHGRLVLAERHEPEAPELVLALVGAVTTEDDESLLSLAAATAVAARARGAQVRLLAWRVSSSGTAFEPVTAPAGATGTALLDWWAGLDHVAVPSPGVLLAAVDGAPGPLLVGATSGVTGLWWADLHAAAATSRTTVLRLS